MNSEIEKYLNLLKGKQLRDIGRSSNIIWLSLGDCLEVYNEKGDALITGKFSLNVQCPCRMVDKEKRKVLFASLDIYEPSSDNKWSEDFEWDVQGNNLFDEKAKKWVSSNESVYIVDYKFNIFRDLRLILSNGNIFEVTIHSSSEDEAWRFFERNCNRDHFVVTGQEVIFGYE